MFHFGQVLAWPKKIDDEMELILEKCNHKREEYALEQQARPHATRHVRATSHFYPCSCTPLSFSFAPPARDPTLSTRNPLLTTRPQSHNQLELLNAIANGNAHRRSNGKLSRFNMQTGL